MIWINNGIGKVCHRLLAKPLPDPTLTYCQLDCQRQTSVKYNSKYKIAHSRKCIWIFRLQSGKHLSRPLCVNKVADVLINTIVSLKILFRQAKLVAFCYQLNVFPKDLGNLLQRLPHKVPDSRPDIYISPFNDPISLPPLKTRWRCKKTFCIRQFEMYFPQRKLLCFDSNFTENSSQICCGTTGEKAYYLVKRRYSSLKRICATRPQCVKIIPQNLKPYLHHG